MRKLILILALLMTRAGAEVVVRESPAEMIISNRCLIAVFNRSHGGFLDSLKTPEGQPLLGGANLYTDYGIYPERVYVGSSFETAPVLSIHREGNAVSLRAEGTLRSAKPLSRKSQPDLHLRYAIEYRMDESAALKVSWSVTPDADKPDVEDAFFAHVFSCPSFSQWFAHTEDGVVIEDDQGCGQRTYQSANNPLSVDAPWIGFLTREGKGLLFSDIKASPPFGNLFFHEGNAPISTSKYGNRGNGGAAALFFAWLSGPPGHPLKKGVPWTGQFSVTVADSLEEAQRPTGVKHEAR